MIVVNDGSTDDTLRAAASTSSASSRSTRRRADVVETEQVLGYYRSPSDPRLLVVDKVNGGKADAPQRRRSTTAGTATSAPSTRTWCSPAGRSHARCARSSRDPEVVGLTSYFENTRDPAASLPDGVRLRRARHAAAVRLPVLRLPPRVLQHPDRVGPAQLHAVRRRRLPDLAARPRRGPARLVADVHVRGHRVHVPRPSDAAPARRPVPHRLPARLRRRHRGARLDAASSSPSASAGSA